MSDSNEGWVRALLRTWFEELDSSDWYASSPEVDAMLRDRFGDDLEREGVKPAASFLGELDTARAAILLLDQIPRNIFREDPRTHATDDRALAAARRAVAAGWDRTFGLHERCFLYLPFEHAEDLAAQAQGFRDADHYFAWLGTYAAHRGLF